MLYPGVTKYREEYVFPQVKETGWIHLNWGLKLFSDDAKRDIRTLNNSTMQCYSNLTQIAAVEFDKLYKQSEFKNDIKLVNIVHDCLYYEVTNSLKCVKYLNDNLPTVMCKQFINDQEMPIKAEIDIGKSLAVMQTIHNNASIETINELLNKLKG